MVELHAVDYVICVGLLLGTLLIGIIHAFIGGKQKTTSEYIVGDRKLHVLPVSISLSASFFSAILILAFPAEAYTQGGMYWLYAVGIAVGAILSCLMFVPVFHPLKLISVNDYLHSRFRSRFVSSLGTMSTILTMIIYAALSSVAPALVMQALLQVPTWATLLIATAITVIYTSIGGIKAVIWTDVFQAFLMLAGLLAISITAISKVGGISQVWEICDQWERLNLVDLRADPTIRLTFWSLTIGVGFVDLNRYGVQQMAVQRFCSLPTLTKARLAVLLLVPTIGVMTFFASLSGITMFAYFTQRGCDPLRAGIIENPNQLVPFFVASTLKYPGVLGVLLASIWAASLSTGSSALNSCAAIVWKDVMYRTWPDMTESKNVLITKLLVAFFGLISMGVAFAFVNVEGTLIEMVITFASICGGPTTAIFFMGIFFPFANWIGVSAGSIIGFTFGLWMGFGSYSIDIQGSYLKSTIENCPVPTMSNFSLTTGVMTEMTTPLLSPISTPIPHGENPLHQLYSVSYLWISCFTMVASTVVGLVVSATTGGMNGQIVPMSLLHPWIRSCYEGTPDDKNNGTTQNGGKCEYPHTKSAVNGQPGGGVSNDQKRPDKIYFITKI